MHHPSGIPEKIVRKVVARRGRLHAFESIEPGRTALVVIDLDTATVGSSEECQRLVPRVNELASAVRSAGGIVAWVTSHMSIMPRHFAAIVGDELATKYFNDGQQDGAGTTLWHELDTSTHDVVAVKSGASAFFPGKCNLKEQLDRAGNRHALDCRRGHEHLLRIVGPGCCRTRLQSDHGVGRAVRACAWVARGHAGDVLPHIRRCPTERRGHRASLHHEVAEQAAAAGTT